MEDIILNLKHCPSQEEIDIHIYDGIKYFGDVSQFITDFMNDGTVESDSISESVFPDTWVFAIVMGMCGKEYFGTNTSIAYGRADNNSEASIVITNKILKYDRLSKELEKLNEKIKSMTYGSSKYEKTLEKIEKIENEMVKYKPV